MAPALRDQRPYPAFAAETRVGKANRNGGAGTHAAGPHRRGDPSTSRCWPERGVAVIIEECVELSEPFDVARERVTEALAAVGFGILTEIDVQATLRKKLGKEMGRYLILGACNPALASRVLDVDPQIGVLLPCSVVLREVGSDVIVEALDPGVMATLTGREEIRPIADEARRLLGDALAALAVASA